MTISDPSMVSKWENLQNSRVFKKLIFLTVCFWQITSQNLTFLSQCCYFHVVSIQKLAEEYPGCSFPNDDSDSTKKLNTKITFGYFISINLALFYSKMMYINVHDVQSWLSVVILMAVIINTGEFKIVLIEYYILLHYWCSRTMRFSSYW